MWICPTCGAANPDTGRFCVECGMPRPADSGAEAPQNRDGRGGRGARTGLWVLLGALVLGCAVLAAILLLRSLRPAPEPAVVETPALKEEPATPAPILIQTPEPTRAFSGYLDDASRLQSKGLEQLCQVMRETVDHNVATSWQPVEHLVRSDYVGFCLLAGKTDSARPRNTLVLVFRNEVNIRIPAEKVDKELSYYYCLRFEDIWCNEDGSLSLSTPEEPAERVTADIPRHSFYYLGYASLEELYRYQVAPYLSSYALSQSIPAELDFEYADNTPDPAEIEARVLAHYKPILSADAREQELFVIFDSESWERDGKYGMTIRYQGSQTMANVYVMDVTVDLASGRVTSTLTNDSPWNLW